MTSRAERNRACPNCGTAVNRQRKVCPACGAVSPWRIEGEAGELVLGDGLMPEGDDPDFAELDDPAINPASDDDGAPEAAITEPPASPLEVLTAPPPQALGAYIVLCDSRVQIGDISQKLRAGQIVEGHQTIRTLLDRGVPMVPRDTAPGFACCPHCNHVFDTRLPSLPTARGMSALQIQERDLLESQRANDTAAHARFIAEQTEEAQRFNPRARGAAA